MQSIGDRELLRATSVTIDPVDGAGAYGHADEEGAYQEGVAGGSGGRGRVGGNGGEGSKRVRFQDSVGVYMDKANED